MKPQLLQFGYVSRAHGLDGEVVVRTFDPQSLVFDDVERVVARPREGEERELRVEGVREGPKGDLLVVFAEIDGRRAAEALVGATLLARREDLPPPGEGEYFEGDLVGLRALDADGRELGVVREVWNTGPVPNLVIRGAVGELVVPFADEFVPAVDLGAGTLTVRPPEFA